MKFSSYVIGNNGFLVVTTIYIYIGATTAQIINLFKDKDSALHKNDMYILIAGGVIIVMIIIFVFRFTNREVKKYLNEQSNGKPKERNSDASYPSDFKKIPLEL